MCTKTDWPKHEACTVQFFITCILTTFRGLLNIKAIRQRSRSHKLFALFLHATAVTADST